MIADLTDLQLPESDQTVVTRPGAERHRRDYYAHFTPLRARICDVDSNQHVNFIALATWYDEAIAAFALKAVGVGEGGLVPDLSPWSYMIHYVGEVTYPGDYEIGILARPSGVDSVHYELGIFRGRTCLGVADAIGARVEIPADSVAAFGTT